MAGNLGGAGEQVARYNNMPFTRQDFPTGFLWGAATSSYQIEGGYKEGCKSLSNWDDWTLKRPAKVADGNNGCLAINHYNRFKEDVKLMKKLGIDTYRLSISWSRILPGGKLSTGVNYEGVKFYNELIDLLLAENIIPFVTIFHFDVPQCLMDEYGAFENPRVVDDFGEYAEVCFYEFGDRVKHWITVNEACTYVGMGYTAGEFPPGHGSKPSELINIVLGHRRHPGNDKTVFGETEPYKVAHNILLSHARAVQIYRSKYQAIQGGKIGITNVSQWYEPYRKDNPEDHEAVERALAFQWGWFTEPVVTGDYPQIMKHRVGKRLPKFTAEEKILMKNSFDFIGMNYYTTYLAQNAHEPIHVKHPTYHTDMAVVFQTKYPDGTPIGKQAGSTWLYIVPRGLYGLLKYNADLYGNPPVYITENGVDEKNERIPVALAVKDDYRIDYIIEHIAKMKKAMDEGVNVMGYIYWSLFDNFEWAEGYTVRFGLYFIDFFNGLTRYPKNSAIWYMNFLKKNPLPPPNIKRQALEDVEADTSSVKKKRARN